MSKSKKSHSQKMATINHVYNRIVWDSRLDIHAFIIGYQERLSSQGIREKPLGEWDSEGDIPWHRIRYVRCGDIIVWDRENHLDLFTGDNLPTAAWKSQVTKEQVSEEVVNINKHASIPKIPQFNPRAVYRFSCNHQAWQIIDQDVNSRDLEANFHINLDRLVVVTFNILCGLYESDKIYTQQRLPVIIEHLRQTDADIIAIQEATPDFVELILTENWVREGYYISEISPAKTVKPFGNFILSRFPFTLFDYRFFGHKRVLVGSWIINHSRLHIGVVHLTSDRGKNAPRKRQQQLITLLSYLQSITVNDASANCLMMGDFNIRGNEQQDTFAGTNFIDIWQELHPNKTGYTFDPTLNPLAALMSREGKPARFDRILLQTHHQELIPTAIDLFACEPIPEHQQVFPSDHFGVRAVLNCCQNPEHHTSNQLNRYSDRPEKISNLQEIKPVYYSAIAIIPPEDIQPAIQAIREEFDQRFERWMPHINLIYGFLPELYFEQAVAIITPILAKLSPFKITLQEYGIFSHRRNCTAWLRPLVEPENALQELQTILENLFPQCNEQSQKSSTGFTPHLSVGQFENPDIAKQKLPVWNPVSFTVDRIALISRQGNQPFTIKHIIKLAKLGESTLENTKTYQLKQLINQLEPQLNLTQQQQHQTTLEIINQACTECLGLPAKLHLFGSAKFGIATPDSDLDIVCLIPNYLSGEDFLHQVEQRLAGLSSHSQLILNARVPILRSQLNGVWFDLVYACVDVQELSLHSQPVTDLLQIYQQRLDATSQLAIIGCIEADLIRKLVTQSLSWELFCDFVRAIKAWAKSRRIYGHNWGFIGGFSWTLLSAWICINYANSQDNLASLLKTFFHTLSQYNWQNPIALTDAAKQYQIERPQDRLPIISSIYPCQNTARNVTRSTSKILEWEFQRGDNIISQIYHQEQSWSELFLNYDFANNHDNLDVLMKIDIQNSYIQNSCIQDDTHNHEIQRVYQNLTAYLISLIIQLEQIGVFVRPHPAISKFENHPQIICGLKLPTNIQREEVEQIIHNFVSQFSAEQKYLNYTQIVINLS